MPAIYKGKWFGMIALLFCLASAFYLNKNISRFAEINSLRSAFIQKILQFSELVAIESIAMEIMCVLWAIVVWSLCGCCIIHVLRLC